MNQAHHVGRCGLNGLAIAERVLAARIFIEEPVRHIKVEIVERVRLVAINLAYDDLALALELTLVKKRITHSVAHEVHGGAKIRAGRGEIVFDDLLARRTVVGDAHLSYLLQVLFRVGDCAVGLEEHVLVKMREAV